MVCKSFLREWEGKNCLNPDLVYEFQSHNNNKSSQGELGRKHKPEGDDFIAPLSPRLLPPIGKSVCGFLFEEKVQKQFCLILHFFDFPHYLKIVDLSFFGTNLHNRIFQ